MNENRAGLGYQNFEEVRTGRIFYLLAGDLLSENEKEYYRGIKAGISDKVSAGAIQSMSGFMYRYYKRKVILILDEYDTPMQDAWISGYWEEAVSFFSGLFNATFKTNDYLDRGLITGITRVAKESMQGYHGDRYRWEDCHVESISIMTGNRWS